MNPKIDAITLAVKDLSATQRFYVDGFGFVADKAHGEFVSLATGADGLTLGLYAHGGLANDAGVPAKSQGFRRFTLSFIVDTANKVDALVERARRAGGVVAKPAKRAIWGGYSAYVTDPDGVFWKIASSKAPPLFSHRPSPAAVKLAAGKAPIRAHEIAIVFGAQDIKATKRFYEALGFAVQKDFGKFVSFELGKGQPAFSLYTREGLADDAAASAEGSGFAGVAISSLMSNRDQVDAAMAEAKAAGGGIIKPAAKAEWGGYFGYFSDADGQLWKVACAS